jgi:hypothetical protein
MGGVVVAAMASLTVQSALDGAKTGALPKSAAGVRSGRVFFLRS